MFKIVKPYITIVASVIILLLALWGILLIIQKQITSVAEDPKSLIPSDAIFVFSVSNPSASFLKFRETVYWQDLLEIEQFNRLDQNIEYIDSVVGACEQLPNLFKESTLLISFHNLRPGESGALFNLRMNRQYASRNASELLKKGFGFKVLNRYDFLDSEIINAKSADYDSLFISVYKGSLLVSRRERLIETSITQYNSGTNILSDEGFVKLKEFSGKNDKIYYNLENLCNSISKIATIDKHHFFDCEGFGKWLALDIHTYDRMLTFNGFIFSGVGNGLMAGSRSYEHSLLPVIPAGSFLLVGKTPADPYYDGVVQAGYAMFVKDFHEKTISPLLAIYMDDDVCVGEVIGKYNPQQLKADDILNGEYSMCLYKTAGSRIFEDLAGPGNYEEFEYIIHKNNYLVAFTDIEAARRWHGFYKNQQTFQHDPNTKMIISNLPSVSNYFFYIHIYDLITFLEDVFTNGTKEFLTANRPVIERFNRFALQITCHTDDLLQTHAIISHDPGATNILRKKWEAKLDDDINNRLFKVVSHVDQSREIIVTDKGNTFYLIGGTGKILWKRELPETLMSDVYQIDYYNNNRYQYLFNTSNYVFLIDRLGRDVANYPLKLPEKASAPMAVFDYENDKDYRLLIPTRSRAILNLDKTGSPVAGWQYTKSNEEVKKPVEHIRLDGKDFLFVTDRSGVPQIINRRGQIRVKTPKNLEISRNNPVYFDESPGKSHFMVSSKNGHLIEIMIEGKISKFAIDDFSRDHFFVYHDLNRNGKKDYLFLDDDQLSVYDNTGKELFCFRFDNRIDQMPLVFDLDEKGVFVGVTDSKANKIYLFSAEGKNIIPFVVEGNVPFTVKKTGNPQTLEIVKGLDDIIRSYRIAF